MPSGTTSRPMPSPAITATRYVLAMTQPPLHAEFNPSGQPSATNDVADKSRGDLDRISRGATEYTPSGAAARNVAAAANIARKQNQKNSIGACGYGETLHFLDQPASG